MNQNIMIQIIIKLIEFFLNPGLIPSQRDQMSQKLSLIFIKSMLENIKWCINVRRASCLLSKYYVINYFQSKKNMISLKQENEKNTSLAAPGSLAHRLQRRTACKIQNGHQGAPKWPTGSGKGCRPRLLGATNKFRKI